jgi:hypothetical protein
MNLCLSLSHQDVHNWHLILKMSEMNFGGQIVLNEHQEMNILISQSHHILHNVRCLVCRLMGVGGEAFEGVVGGMCLSDI